MNNLLKQATRLVYNAVVQPRPLRLIINGALIRIARTSRDKDIINNFIDEHYGEACGISYRDRALLLELFRRNVQAIPSGTSQKGHVIDGGEVFTDDAEDMDVVSIFFDKEWWAHNLQSLAPGFIGGGCGLPLSAQGSSFGYVRKTSQFTPAGWRMPWLSYPESQDFLESVQ